MGLLSRLGGGANVLLGRGEARLGQALHNIARPSDYRGALPEWAGMARRGLGMVDSGLQREARGYAMLEGAKGDQAVLALKQLGRPIDVNDVQEAMARFGLGQDDLMRVQQAVQAGELQMAQQMAGPRQAMQGGLSMTQSPYAPRGAFGSRNLYE